MVASQENGPSQQLGVAASQKLYDVAVVDLLGAIAYGEISAFERMAEDARSAPTLRDKVDLVTMATSQFAKVDPIRRRLVELDADPFAAMEPFREAVDLFHQKTAPSDWWESLVKAYVGDGLANDFYREIAVFLDASTRELVESTLEDSGRTEFVVDRVRGGIEADPTIAGRLALWGRRLMGEALTQAQLVTARRDALSELLSGGHIDGLDLTFVADMFGRITHRHVERMSRLGLAH